MITKKNKTVAMKEIRKRIDKVDSKLIPLMVRRSKLVNKALELKTKKSEIVDVRRINQIKNKVIKKTN